MSKVSERIETIFSHAVALQQDGRFRSTIYCFEKMIYILNQDMQVLLRFPLRQYETEFEHPVTFFANDYDSRNFREENGKICFIQEDADYERIKKCRIPETQKKNPREIFQRVMDKGDLKVNRVLIKKNILNFLEDDLSHIEFSCENGKLKIVQRNIVTGALIEIRKKEGKGLIEEKDDIKDFGVVAIRSNDFRALFSFVEEVDFYFSNLGFAYFKTSSGNIKMDGLAGQCTYKEMMEGDGDGDGRKKSKVRRDK